MKLKAKWIWKKQRDYNLYNDTVIARKTFSPGRVANAVIRITADSFYRLYINDKWVNDGPARSWPEHYQYDRIDVTESLKSGSNEIKVIARYYGVGDFHGVRKQAGLLVQLDLKLKSGNTRTIISDSTWSIARAKSWISNTPKIAIQMAPAEYYDARLEDRLRYDNAAVLFEAGKGPWRNLNRRDVPLMTKKPFSFKSCIGAKIVKAVGLDFCIPVTRLMHPGLIEANRYINAPVGLATMIKVKKKCTVRVKSKCVRDDDLAIAVDARSNPSGRYNLSPGSHFVLAFTKGILNHDKEVAIRFIDPPRMTLENPLEPSHENPWCFIPFKEFTFACDDMNWSWFFEENPDAHKKADDFNKLATSLLKKVKDKKTFLEQLAGRAKCIPSAKMFVRDSYWQFLHRRVIGDAGHLVDNPEHLLRDDDEFTVVRPAAAGDVELAYDLGEQNCGLYRFELVAQAGVLLDINGIEYIARNGSLQHTAENKNGMRYITKEGVNRFTSLKRRSGRYIFITLRNQTRPVKIRKIDLVESTYPVEYKGSFSCSDKSLNRIWDISARTLKLCMEDTFTDCPVYEQTLWVGDARNEALFAYTTFGAADIARRCIRLAAQSLRRYPIVGCQVPSSWECLLPAWSFLWGISVWDYYWYTGDKKFLRRIFKAVIKNLKGAEKFIDERGLFTTSFWNFFDWAGIDQDRKTVLHNSMFLVGAIDAALKCAAAIGDKQHVVRLRRLRRRVTKAINGLWDKKKKAYPDSIHEDETVSDSTSQHTCFLSVLYDIVEEKNIVHALKNMTDPPKPMVRVGSPFAVLYLYEALEKLGLQDEIIRSIYHSYLPMLRDRATTVWESFSAGTLAHDKFPTRSHCHGWSAAPLYFLSRIILGIRQTSPGGKSYDLSPRLSGLSRAHGSIAAVNGPVNVSWQLTGKTLDVKFAAPEHVRVNFIRNDSLKGLTIILNGRKTQKANKERNR